MTFSVVIPVYNIAVYLTDCVDSVLAALNEEDEIILSLRPSGDGSDELAARYAAGYENIRIVKQSGKGLADARNSAMPHTRGDYILFVDGDDYVDPAELKRLLDGIRTGIYAADIIMTDYYADIESTGRRRLLRQIGERTMRGLDKLPSVICRTSAFWTVWRNVYRASFLRKNRLSFCDTIFNEDADYISRILVAQPDILFLNHPFYHYRQEREGSLTRADTLLRMRQNEMIFRESIARLRDTDCAWTAAAVTGYQYGYVMNIALLSEILPNERKYGKELFNCWRDALIPSTDTGIQVFSGLLRAAGISVAARILHSFKKCKRKREGRRL